MNPALGFFSPASRRVDVHSSVFRSSASDGSGRIIVDPKAAQNDHCVTALDLGRPAPNMVEGGEARGRGSHEMKRVLRSLGELAMLYVWTLWVPALLLAGAGSAVLLETDDDYRPQFSQLTIGMRKAAAIAVLRDINFEQTRSADGVDVIFFREPDFLNAYHFTARFKNGVLVSKDYDDW
jgi:hypothetical protein